MATKTKWKVISNVDGFGLECQKCKHKISLVGVLFADISIKTCPFCESEMDIDSIDEDALLRLSEGNAT